MRPVSSLHSLANRAAGHPRFLGHRLEQARAARGWTVEELADYLGCDTPGLARLYLCGVPVGAARVQRVAEYAGCDAGRLAGLLDQE